MPYDPKDIYRRLAELLGGSKGDPSQSRGEYWDIPGLGDIRLQPVDPSGWDTSEVWMSNGKPRFAEGEIPDWLSRGMGFMTAAAQKGASPEDMNYLARHWIYGEGVNPGYQAAFDAMPQYARDYVRSKLGQYLANQGQGQGQVGGRNAQPQ